MRFAHQRERSRVGADPLSLLLAHAVRIGRGVVHRREECVAEISDPADRKRLEKSRLSVDLHDPLPVRETRGVFLLLFLRLRDEIDVHAESRQTERFQFSSENDPLSPVEIKVAVLFDDLRTDLVALFVVYLDGRADLVAPVLIREHEFALRFRLAGIGLGIEHEDGIFPFFRPLFYAREREKSGDFQLFRGEQSAVEQSEPVLLPRGNGTARKNVVELRAQKIFERGRKFCLRIFHKSFQRGDGEQFFRQIDLIFQFDVLFLDQAHRRVTARHRGAERTIED